MDPVQLIKIRMTEMNIKAKDLAELYGDKGNISKVLNYERGLCIKMIRIFSKALSISADDLIPEYPLKQKK